MSTRLTAWIAGFVFALGLGISGMTDPAKVIAFLDFTGAWDPALIFVMGGAVVTYAIGFRIITRNRETPLCETRFCLPTHTQITRQLVTGSLLFGLGWGLSGLCPGPAITSTLTGSTHVFVFLAALASGMLLYRWYDQPHRKRISGRLARVPLQRP